jgi:hypothetical protein
MAVGLVGGEAFAADASMIAADARRRRGVASSRELARRALKEYLAVLDSAAFGGATLGRRAAFLVAPASISCEPLPILPEEPRPM